jgi:acetyl-CoA acetyltransferase
MAEVYVIGVGMTRFGKHPDQDSTQLGVTAIRAAIRDAGLDPRRIQAAYCGHVFQGMVTGQRILAQIGLAGLPLANVENACSSGATAIREAYLAIKAGEYDVVLAVGTEHMTTRFKGALTPDPGDIEAAVGLTMPAVYGMRAVRYLADHGVRWEQFAAIPVKNKKNAALNPFSQFQQPVTREAVLSSRPIADPLRLLDCAPVSDGAAAVILAGGQTARSLAGARGIRLAASALRTGEVPVAPGSMSFEPLTAATALDAYERAGIAPADVGFAEVHDCFTIAEALRVEGLGLFEPGSYPAAVERGRG